MQEQRDEQFCMVVLTFATAKTSFDEQIAHYRSKGEMDFQQLDAFVEQTLFSLKEDCHFLFRGINRHQPTEGISSEELFDISIGSIFHELMKIKESVYQLSYYAPLYSAMAKSVNRHDAPSYERAFLDACRKIVRRAKRNLPSDLSAAEELFRDAADNLKIMLRGHTGNPLLARMIIDEQELVKKCFGLDNIDELLVEVYDQKLDEAHLAAARDYLTGGWYEKARREAQTVLEIDPDNIEAAQIARKLDEKLKDSPAGAAASTKK